MIGIFLWHMSRGKMGHLVNVGWMKSNIFKQAKLSLNVMVLFSLFISHSSFSVQALGPNMLSMGIQHSENVTLAAAVQIIGRDSLEPGEQLHTDEQLTSSDGRFHLSLQGDGNLVLYQNKADPLWTTGTQGSGATHLVMQSDGNLVLYTKGNIAVWATGTQKSGAIHLGMQNDGNLVLYRANGTPVWASNTNQPILAPDSQLNTDEQLTSLDGRFSLIMQGDSNLVLYRNGVGPVWSTCTQGSGATHLIMQSDGNLVLRTAKSVPVWASNTVGGRSILKLQNDGNLVIYRDGTATAVWATNTDQYGAGSSIQVSVELSYMKALETTESDLLNDRDEIYFIVKRVVPINSNTIRLPTDGDYYEFKNNWTSEKRGWTNQDQKQQGTPVLWQGELRVGESADIYVSIGEQDNKSLGDAVKMVSEIGKIVVPVAGALLGVPAVGTAATKPLDDIAGIVRNNRDNSVASFVVSVRNEGCGLKIVGQGSSNTTLLGNLYFEAKGDNNSRYDFRIEVKSTFVH